MTSARMVRLGDLGEWAGGNTPSKANPANWLDGTVPWVSPKDMKVDEITSSEDRITEAALNDGRVSLVPEGSVLFVTRSGILAHTLPVAVTKIAVSINQDLKALTPRAGVLPEYIAHAVRGASRRILKECSKHGTTVASIETNALLHFKIPVVDVGEQCRIVAEIEKQFSRLDEAVATLKRVKANLHRLRARVLLDAVEGRPTRPLGSLLREPLRNGHSARATSDPNGLRAFTLTAVTEGDFSERNTKRTVADPTKVAGLWAQPGDIYIQRSNTPELVGTARLYAGPSAFAFIPDLLIRVRVDESALRSAFAEIALTCERGRRYFRTKAQGIAGSMPKIDQGVVERFEMPVPTVGEQDGIVAEVDRRLSIVREIEAEVDANLKRAQALRQAVLARAFGG